MNNAPITDAGIAKAVEVADGLVAEAQKDLEKVKATNARIEKLTAEVKLLTNDLGLNMKKLEETNINISRINSRLADVKVELHKLVG